jgi:hypothetical protein
MSSASLRSPFRSVAFGILAAVSLIASDESHSARPATQGTADTRVQQRTAGAPAQQRAEQIARTRFRSETIVDTQHGGLVAMRYSVPEDWRATSSLTWTYSDFSLPVRIGARAEASDGSAWVEIFPSEVFFWLQPALAPVPYGQYSLGLIHWPDIGAVDALQRFVVLRYRGQMQNLRLVGWRPVPDLARALGEPAQAGESIAIRIAYQLDGQPVDEEFYALLGEGNRVPYHGPYGTTYEFHRPLTYVHSIGAKGGTLESRYPLLGFIAASFETDPVWRRHAQQVVKQLAQQFNQFIAQGYARIQAAARLSNAVTVHSEAISAMMREQHVTASASQDRIHDNFTQYIRGTDRVRDPRGGTSEQPAQYRYHWADALGAVQHSDDPNYDPNVGSTTTWQPMVPLR